MLWVKQKRKRQMMNSLIFRYANLSQKKRSIISHRCRAILSRAKIIFYRSLIIMIKLVKESFCVIPLYITNRQGETCLNARIRDTVRYTKAFKLQWPIIVRLTKIGHFIVWVHCHQGQSHEQDKWVGRQIRKKLIKTNLEMLVCTYLVFLNENKLESY